MRSAKFRGVTFHSAGQLWSNPSMRNQEQGIPAMMVQPSFLDLVTLAATASIDTLRNTNRTLRQEGLIGDQRFALNESMLENISTAQNALRQSSS